MSRFTGKVVYRDLEGGLFELHADDGRRYQLVGKSFRDGERIAVEGEVEEGSFGIAMTSLPLLRVHRIDR